MLLFYSHFISYLTMINLNITLAVNWSVYHHVHAYKYHKLFLRLLAQQPCNKITLDANARASSVPLFNRFHWLPFYNETRIAQFSIPFKRIQLTVSKYLIESLRLNNSMHSRNTRFSKCNFISPRFNVFFVTNFFKEELNPKIKFVLFERTIQITK